jgi:hypothetical protein
MDDDMDDEDEDDDRPERQDANDTDYDDDDSDDQTILRNLKTRTTGTMMMILNSNNLGKGTRKRVPFF